jgi:2-polyprenyl-6-methoxyphenol hydroxylase-like FAD-dependent oxidoreductase
MAIEDAAVLAHCIAHASDLTQAFMRFESMRRPRIEAVAALTSRNRAQKQVTGRLGRLLRRLILPIVLPAGIRASRQLFAYRIATDVPLAEPASKENVDKPIKDTVP